MSAHYDNYDYPSYWKGREYEHEAEVYAIQCFFKKIPKLNKIVEIGAGYGRLLPSYYLHAKKIILTDPSSKLLNLAKKKLDKFKINYIHAGINSLPHLISEKSVNLILIVRVLHHIKDLDQTFNIINKITKKGGYLILEFANKRHIKSLISEFSHGNFKYFKDTSPKDISFLYHRGKSISSIPFYNYHPEYIENLLQKKGYRIIEKRSVSNIRSSTIKNIMNTKTLLFFEKIIQIPFSKIYFGPSIFILAKKNREI